jgi:DNA-binding beta-propeller fold protein YncE
VASEGFEKPNGLAFSPDARTLYVCDTAKYHVRAFAVDADGHGGGRLRRVFATMDPGQPGGPDGMKVDRDGRVYVAVALGVWSTSPTAACWGSSACRSARPTWPGGAATAGTWPSRPSTRSTGSASASPA